jgi:hypothetical protein
MKYIWLLLLICATLSSKAQKKNYNFLLQSLNDSTKTKEITVCSYSYNFRDSIDPGGFFDAFESEFDLSIEAYMDSTISGNYTSEYIHGYYNLNSDPDCAESFIAARYYYTSDANYQQKKLHLNKINALTIDPELKYYVDSGIWISFIGALAIAPAVSYNFKRGEMNNKRYRTIAGISLLSAASFIALRIPLRDKKIYQLRNVPGKKAEWKIIDVNM